jgi:hypothetical protein
MAHNFRTALRNVSEPLGEVREGFRLLENREVFGKVIVTP